MTVQQTFVENIFHEMGYASSTDYAIKKVREELLHELKVCLERIEKFEKSMAWAMTSFTNGSAN